jgi:hypothetical protein
MVPFGSIADPAAPGCKRPAAADFRFVPPYVQFEGVCQRTMEPRVGRIPGFPGSPKLPGKQRPVNRFCFPESFKTPLVLQ